MGKYRSIVLAKLPSPPTLQMVREIMIQSQELPGSAVQIPFGKAGFDTYFLRVTVASKDAEANCVWTLYRGENLDSPIEWTYTGGDTEKVFNYLTTRFPAWSEQSKTMTAEVQTLKKQLRHDSVARSAQRSTLEGDLSNMPVTNLLQSIAMNKMTGRLEIRNDGDKATVWFDEGSIAHCETPDGMGDDALIELICWEKGEFYFFPDTKIEMRTVKKRMEILIMEGAIFHDLHTALMKLGFTFDSIVFRKNDALTKTDFEATLYSGIPVDHELQKRIYCELSPEIPFADLMDSLHLSKIQVVPIIFNLLSLDVVALKKITPIDAQGGSTPFENVSEVNASGVNAEASDEQLDWHKVQKKTEAATVWCNSESSSIDFVGKIKGLTGLERPAQPNKKFLPKGRGVIGFLFESFFHPVLLLLLIVMTCLYLQAGRINEQKPHPKNLPASTKTSTQHGFRRYHVGQ